MVMNNLFISHLNIICTPIKPMKTFVCSRCEDLIANNADQCSREPCQEATAKPCDIFAFDMKNALSRIFKDLNSSALFHFYVCFSLCFFR